MIELSEESCSFTPVDTDVCNTVTPAMSYAAAADKKLAQASM